MNLYSFVERAFGEDEARTATLFSTQAATVLANSQAYWDARDLNTRLGEAMEFRAAIEQAKGMLMTAQSSDPDEALSLPVRASQRENVPLRDIAARMVDDAIRRAQRSGANRDLRLRRLPHRRTPQLELGHD